MTRNAEEPWSSKITFMYAKKGPLRSGKPKNGKGRGPRQRKEKHLVRCTVWTLEVDVVG